MSPEVQGLKCAILVGGKSSRMGQDKHKLNIHGAPQYEYLYQLTTSVGLPTFLSCRTAQSTLFTNYPQVTDSYPGIGPMGGIASAFESDPTCDWLIIACDLIFLDHQGISQLLHAREDGADIVTFQGEVGALAETTLTIYRPSVVPHMIEAIRKNRYSLQPILRAVNTVMLAPHQPDILKNANSPDDLTNIDFEFTD